MASTTYTLKSTDGNTIIVIGAGATSGNTGIGNHDTDLLLYGRGTFNWGSGIEQNLIRLTENWATPSESGNANADPDTEVPKSYGLVNIGIEKPMRGQTWFNKTNSRLYVNAGSSSSPVWERVDKNSFSLTDTDDQETSGKLRVSSSNGQPDIYIYSNTPTYGIGAGPIDTLTGLPTDAASSSYITFEANKGTEAAPIRVRSAYIAALHKDDNILRIALGDRDAANSYGAVQNRIDLKADYTETSKNIQYIGPGQITGAIDDKTLTTREWVENYVTDEFASDLAGNSTYLRLSDTTARIQTDGDARYLQLTGGQVTGALYQGSGTAVTVMHNGTVRTNGGSPYTRMTANSSITGQPSYTLASTHIAGSAFNNTGDPDEVRSSFSMKLIQGSYSGNAYPRNNTTPSDSPFPIATDSVALEDRDTIVFEKYDVTSSTFTTTQAIIMFDDYIATHQDNGYIRTPETKMFGEAGYNEFTLLTVGKATNYFCKQGFDIDVEQVNASDMVINNGSTPASIYLLSQEDTSITLDASNNNNTASAQLRFRGHGGQLGMLRIIGDTGGDDAIALQRMNGGAAPNQIRLYENRTTLSKRLQIGGSPHGGTAYNGSLTLYAKDNSTAVTDDYAGTTTEDDYVGIVFRKQSGSFVGSILSNNIDSMVFRTPTNPSVIEAEAPLFSLSNNTALLQNMRMQAVGSSLAFPSTSTQLAATSNYYAMERSVYQLTDRRYQAKSMGNMTKVVDVAANETGWFDQFSPTKVYDDNASDYQGFYSDHVEFDFTDTTAQSFSQTYSSVSGKVHRVLLTVQFGYHLIHNSSVANYPDEESVQIHYETGPSLSAPSQISLGNFVATNVGSIMIAPNSSTYSGTFYGQCLIPVNPGDKVQVRFDRIGPVSQFGSWTHALLSTSYFTAQII